MNALLNIFLSLAALGGERVSTPFTGQTYVSNPGYSSAGGPIVVIKLEDRAIAPKVLTIRAGLQAAGS